MPVKPKILWNSGVEEWVLRHKLIVAYLYPPPIDQIGIVKIRPDDKFYRVLADELNSYITNGKQPAAEIAQTVYNMADDFFNNRPITLKTGDYISVQGYLRKVK